MPAMKCGGPGYRSPMEAKENGPKERILYVTCIQPNGKDYLATVDVDQSSPTYGQVLHRTVMPNLSDELHHSGWNTCSSCYGDCSAPRRDKLILPCLNSSRIYVVHVDGKQTSIHKVIEPDQLAKLNVSMPHTSHCLPNGHVMISCLGDANGHKQGAFLLLDGTSFEPVGLWNDRMSEYGYDFWYKPRFDVLISTEWGTPQVLRQGFNPKTLEDHYGHSIHVWQYSTGKLIKSVDLRSTGKAASMPLEIRFLHDPNSCYGFVACAYSSNVFRFVYQPEKAPEDADKLLVEEVIQVKPKQVTGSSLGDVLPALLTDIIISLDDQFLFVSAWAYGEVRQYCNLTGKELSLVSMIRLGGLLSPIYPIEVLADEEPEPPVPTQTYHKIRGITLNGGAQMLQLSLDGQRLYVTNSLYSVWDRQFYPQMLTHGSQMVKVNISEGVMSVDETFLVDFGADSHGPALAHEMRYPGGDCTSDIWI